MSEEKEKPKKITITVAIPTKETIVEALKKMFPMLEVKVEEEKPEEKKEEP